MRVAIAKERVLRVAQAHALPLEQAIQRVAIDAVESLRGVGDAFEFHKAHRSVAFELVRHLPEAWSTAEDSAQLFLQLS